MRQLSSFGKVNLDDFRQDVHRVRAERRGRNYYRVAEALLPPNPRGLTVLELSGGAAEFSRGMQTLGIEVTFVVLSLANVKGARLLGMAALQLDLNDGLPGLPDNSYDGVVMLEVIEHIVAAEQLLREVARVLKPGGFLILSTPNFAYWCNRLRILAGKGSQDEGCHYRFFTPAVLRDRLRDADLEIMQTAHTMPAMGYNFIANRLLRRARRHVHVPDLLAPLFAHTLIVKSAKHSVTST